MQQQATFNLDNLPKDAQLTLGELETSKAKGRRGIIALSGSHILRLEAQGLFPKARRIKGTRSKFYLAGEVAQWLKQQAENVEG